MKIFFVAVLLSFPICLSANMSGCLCKPWNGFYLGGGGGVSANKIKHHVDSTVIDIDMGTAFSDLQAHESDTHFSGLGEIFFGYGKQCSCLYLGGKIGVNFLNSDNKKFFRDDIGININAIFTELRNTEVTFDFKPGWVHGRTMVFGIFGAALNNQDLKGESSVLVFGEENTIQFKQSNARTGFRVGGGIEHFFFQCLSLQVSYVYSDYRRVRANRAVEFVSQNVNYLHALQFSSEICRVNLSIGAAYYF